MAYERPCRIKPSPPVLPEIMARINCLKGQYYENIDNEINTVRKYFTPFLISNAHFIKYKIEIV
jgi:hypothetical protein